MKTKEQVVIFIKTLEDLIPKLKLKQQEYLIQGNEFGYNVLKDKIKEQKFLLFFYLISSIVFFVSATS